MVRARTFAATLLAGLVALAAATPLMAKEPPPPRTVYLEVSGVTWGGCAARVAAVLERTPGVLSSSINAKRTQVTVVRKGEERRDADLAESVAGEGFGAKVIPTSNVVFAIASDRLADAQTLLGKAKGVLRVGPDKEPGRLVVTVDTRHTDGVKLAAALTAAEIPAHAVS